jgi:PAS domain S-box-containing protein
VTGPDPGGALSPGQYRLGEPTYRALVEAAPDAILAVDPAGVIVLVNAQAERLFGYRRDDLLGHQVEALVPHGVRPMHQAHRIRYFAEPTARPMGAGMQLSARRRDGTEFPAEISLSTVRTVDGMLIAAAVRDVTDRIEAQADRERLRAQSDRDRLESRLLQSQRLESLGQLAGGIAHDFNNLLGVILNYSSFVEEEIAAAAAADPATPWAAAQSDLEQIRRAAERATELTHQLLAFGRREVVRPRVLNLNDVVADVQDMLRRTLGEHVELTTSLDPDLWCVLAGPGSRRARMCCSGSPTPAAACRRRSSARRSSPSSPPRPRARAPGWAWRPCTGSSRRPTGTCRSPPRPAPAPPSPCCCRPPRSSRTRRPSRSGRRSAPAPRPCWWSRTRTRSARSRAGSWTATATGW